jgi:hypothetical protein
MAHVPRQLRAAVLLRARPAGHDPGKLRAVRARRRRRAFKQTCSERLSGYTSCDGRSVVLVRGDKHGVYIY